MERFLIILLIFIITNSCNKVDLDAVPNLNGGQIWVIGHAGSGFQTGRHPVPTNSEVSFEIAIEGYGADGCEMDLQLSKDSIPILFHDSYVDGSTGCTGCIYENHSTDLLNCNYRKDFAVNIFHEEKIIALEKILARYVNSEYDPIFFLDLKLYHECNSGDSAYIVLLANQLIRIIHSYNAEDKIFIITGHQSLIDAVRNTDNNPKPLLFIGSLNKPFKEEFDFTLNNHLYGLTIGNEQITADEIKEAHANNLRVILYDVKSRASAIEAVEKSPDGIMTDNIQLLQEVLK